MEIDSKSDEYYYLTNYRNLKRHKTEKDSETIYYLNRKARAGGNSIMIIGSKNDGAKHKEMKDYIAEYIDYEESIKREESDISKILKKVEKAVNMVWMCDNETGYVLKRYYLDNDYPKCSKICEELFISTSKYWKLKKNALFLYSKYYNNL